MASGKDWCRHARKFHAIEEANRTLARWTKAEEEERALYHAAHARMLAAHKRWEAAVVLRAWATEEASRIRFAYDHPGLGGRPYSDDYTDEELGI